MHNRTNVTTSPTLCSAPLARTPTWAADLCCRRPHNPSRAHVGVREAPAPLGVAVVAAVQQRAHRAPCIPEAQLDCTLMPSIPGRLPGGVQPEGAAGAAGGVSSAPAPLRGAVGGLVDERAGGVVGVAVAVLDCAWLLVGECCEGAAVAYVQVRESPGGGGVAVVGLVEVGALGVVCIPDAEVGCGKGGRACERVSEV